MPTLPKRRKPKIPFEGREVDPFYNNTRWRTVRKAYLMAHPMCVKCQQKGIITEATVVDHKIPIRQGGDEYSWTNLQSLCASCHNKKSAREQGNAMQTNFEKR